MTIAEILFHTFNLHSAFQESIKHAIALEYSKDGLTSTHTFKDNSKLTFNYLSPKTYSPYSMTGVTSSYYVKAALKSETEIEAEKTIVLDLVNSAITVLKQNQELKLKVKELKKQIKANKIKNSIRVVN